MPTPSLPTPVSSLLAPVPGTLAQSYLLTPGPGPASAPPAGWSLPPAQSPSAGHQERTSAEEPPADQPSQRFTLRVPAPSPAPDAGIPSSDDAGIPPSDAAGTPPSETVGPEPSVESGPAAEPEPHGTAAPPSPCPNSYAV